MNLQKHRTAERAEDSAVYRIRRRIHQVTQFSNYAEVPAWSVKSYALPFQIETEIDRGDQGEVAEIS